MLVLFLCKRAVDWIGIDGNGAETGKKRRRRLFAIVFLSCPWHVKNTCAPCRFTFVTVPRSFFSL